VPVLSTDTPVSLMPRIHALEHRIFPQALQWLAEERLKIEGRRVHLLPAKMPGAGMASHGRGPLGPWMVAPPLEDF
jgi:phosphoribosylglycinamide formyltransferase-1